MTLEDEPDDRPPLQPPHDDRTAYGRICGRDREIYAKAWGIPLDYVEDGVPIGEQLFRYACMDMSMEYSEVAPRAQWGEGPDEEQFALRWRPKTLSEMIEDEIERHRAEETERIAALGRQPREQEGRDGLKTRDSDPETHH